MAVIDVIAGAGLLLPAISLSGPLAASSGIVCGGGLSAERLAIFLDVGAAPITIVNSPPRDPDTGYPLITFSYTAGGPLQQPDPILFQAVAMGISSGSYDVKSIMRNPDPANIPPSGWLSVTPSSSGLPAMVAPRLDSTALGTLAPCDYEGYITISSASAGSIVKLKLALSEPAGGSTGGGSQPNVTKIMSQIADGGAMIGGWKTTIILVNTDSMNPAAYQLLFHPGKNGDQPISPDAPFNVLGPGQVANRTYQGSIPAGGSVTLSTAGPGAPFWQGWAELTAPDSVGGTAIFAYAVNASSDAEGSVLLKPPVGTSFLLPFDNNSAASLVTSMALVNTSATLPANVTVKFHNESGAVFGQSSVSLPASGHEAFTLISKFPELANKRGVAEFISDGPALSGLGLRFNDRQNTFTSFEITTPQAGGLRQAIAHIADGNFAGGTWKTTITLLNLDTTQSNSVTLKFHNGEGTPASQQLLLENGASGTYTATLGPGGSATITTSGGAQLWRGWAEVASSTTLGGFAVFRFVQTTGQLEGTVSFTPLGSSRFVIPFDNALATGIGIANTSDQSATVTATFRNPASAEIAGQYPKTMPLASAAHRSFTISDPAAPLGGAPLDKLTGVADFTSTSPGLVGIGLRFSPRNAFTSLPVILK
jgi:hypothetical protein